MVNILLVGNPNVGKSTLFNALTGLRQHTGNWPGKTVEAAVGTYDYHGERYRLTDLPGLYSLDAGSPEERLAAEQIACGADCTVVVCDATCLEKSLILALQVMRCSRRMVLCLNLCDEAARRGIHTDVAALSRRLSLPVVATAGSSREGLDALRQTVRDTCDGFLPATPAALFDGAGEEGAVSAARLAGEICAQVQRRTGGLPGQERLDRLLLSRWLGYPAALALLLLVLWLTIWGANAPGRLLEAFFSYVQAHLRAALSGWPEGLAGFMLDGVFDTVARVVTVMLPPMAIFFPLFTLLEDLGLLPRLAFLLDRPLERCGACGKQALTSCMSLGCNAVGVTGCRIIDSPRERLLAILTASFLPCNGRFPALILLVSLLCAGSGAGTAFGVALCLALAMGAVLLVTKLLSRTVLRGTGFGFVLELPPYRKPRVLPVIVRAFLDRTLRVLGRAVGVAAPAGGIIWLLAHGSIGGRSLLAWAAGGLEPFGAVLGLSGPILLAFLLGAPANELVLPLLLLIGTGQMSGDLAAVLSAGGPKGIVCMLLFTLFHWPCITTILTIRRETGSLRWTLGSILLPTAVGCLLCALVQLLW